MMTAQVDIPSPGTVWLAPEVVNFGDSAESWLSDPQASGAIVFDHAIVAGGPGSLAQRDERQDHLGNYPFALRGPQAPTTADGTRPSTRAVAVKLLKPRFGIDYSGVRRDDDGDFLREDLANLLGQEIFIDSAIKLRDLASAPTLIFAPSPGSLRSIAARFRLAGCNAMHLDDGVAVETVRKLAGDLAAGRLDVLLTINRLAGTTPIPGVHSIGLMRPTLRPEVHQRFISRLNMATAPVVVIDMVGNIDRFPLPPECDVTIITEPPIEILRDPFIAKLESAPHRTVMAWAGRNIDRLEVIRRAKNYKPGWIYNAVKSFDPGLADRWWRAWKGSGCGLVPDVEHEN